MRMLRFLGCALGLLSLVATPAFAHDTWINRERRTNAAGEWCCNVADCSVVQAKETPRGYLILDTGEEVPRAEWSLSGDADFWICRRADKSIRCAFAPAGF